MFIILWKYNVKPENRDAFELEYGGGGVWEKLFANSEGYAGSYLHRGADDSSYYLVTDRWESREAFDFFIFTHNETYKKLNDLLSHLYESEERIGAFNLMD